MLDSFTMNLILIQVNFSKTITKDNSLLLCKPHISNETLDFDSLLYCLFKNHAFNFSEQYYYWL